jgi:gliding motility-associated-like protein
MRTLNAIKALTLHFFSRKLLLFACLNFMLLIAVAQPSSNECSQASAIIISNDGFGLGTFHSSPVDITAANLQTGETFAPSILASGLNKKSIWYKFTLPTTRAVSISLEQQGGNIQAGNVGFTIYKTGSCIPGNAQISDKLTPIETFGTTFNPCIDAGEYLVQVSGNNNANGVVLVSLTISDATNAAYDKPVNAQQFGILTKKKNSVDFMIDCQSIESINENCLPNGSFKDFTKSTWHTFTTPGYFDYLSLWTGLLPAGSNLARQVIGYRLYEGDITKTPINSLTVITSCDSLTTDRMGVDKKIYSCGILKTNKTYSIQLLFHKDFNKNIRFAIIWDGDKPSTGIQPTTSLASPNKIGTLQASVKGEVTSIDDYFSCNSKHIAASCQTITPKGGIKVNGMNYNMSLFYTFSVSATINLDINTTIANCGSKPAFIRLFRQKAGADCSSLDTANIIAGFSDKINFNCFQPGDYVLQVMGIDSSISSNTINSNSIDENASNLCFRQHLGRAVLLTLKAGLVYDVNNFGLSAAGQFEKINAVNGVMKPLMNHQVYTAKPDTFGCASTVLPNDKFCSKTDTIKATYREFVLADSMTVSFSNLNAMNSKLYMGDAGALAEAQGAFSYPKKITGLKPWAVCLDNTSDQRSCLIPGTYTLVSFGGVNSLGAITKGTIAADVIETRYNSPSKAEDMGSLWDSVIKNKSEVILSKMDTFSCRDNTRSIGGVNACDGATKLIYRQFYLSEPALLNINLPPIDYPSKNRGRLTLFRGRATDGVAKLTPVGEDWTCFNTARITDQCNPMPAGWYTLVAYGHGPTFSVPIKNSDVSSDVGFPNQVRIILEKACPTPEYNRPFKASVDTATRQPYLIQWGPQQSHSAAYPVTNKTYTLAKENFNCQPDTPFSSHPIISCDPEMKHVAYWVFTTTQESFVQINTGGYWGSLFGFDVRKDSSKMISEAPIQSCLKTQGKIEICKLQPGIYTLVIFSEVRANCHNVQPTIYIDQVGYSRFDHANKAYDFGELKGDSVWYKGKKGDINPLNSNRAPSDDIIYCTTGAQKEDPDKATCSAVYNPLIYSPGKNIVLHPADSLAPTTSQIDRRNLWYTAVVKHAGTIRFRVAYKTSGKPYPPRYAIYASDEDYTVPFDELVKSGRVNSTMAQGLKFVGSNAAGIYCASTQEIEIYNDPCTFRPSRYYIVVDNRPPSSVASYSVMSPNHQLDVAILLDSTSVIGTKFDTYSNAYDFGEVNSGKVAGAKDNFTCATRNVTDPYTGSCQKTLWYKFTTKTTGYLRYRINFKNNTAQGESAIQLFSVKIEGDSTKKGLEYLASTSRYKDPSNNYYWSQRCISPGTYYLILPGCNAVNEDVYPEIEVLEQAGDFCTRPVTTSLNGPGSRLLSAVIDCHTIGTDYGEFNTTLSCPAGVEKLKYKSSWYRIDVGGKDTLDVMVFINEQTNAGSSEIKYRMMTGDCDAMQEQSCVQDALTKNTYKCLAPGSSYFIQVFTPILSATKDLVTGTIDLNISAVGHADTCLPGNACIAVASFTSSFDCVKDRAVQFNNFSTYGDAIRYDWDFGYNNQTSNAVSPAFNYPALTVDKKYSVRLIVSNINCDKKDTATLDVLVPARPYVFLGNDTSICTSGSTIKLDATSHPGAIYKWSNGSTAPSVNYNKSGNYWVQVSYNNCISRDTIDLFISPIVEKKIQTYALCGTNDVVLDASRGKGEQYKWNDGSSGSKLTVSKPGIYWADLYLEGCVTRDSFLVISSTIRPLGSDTSICEAQLPLKLNATIPGATSYKWNNNASSPSISISQAGNYWVTVTVDGCSITDTVSISVDPVQRQTLSAAICAPEKYIMPGGKRLSVSGTYIDTLRNIRGCDSLITALNLVVTEKKESAVTISICQGQTYTLPSGLVVWQSGIYNDTVKNKIGCDSIITHADLRVAMLSRDSMEAAICSGNSYMLPSGRKVSTTGIYSDTLRFVAGCDSIIYSVKLLVNTPLRQAISAVACDGRAYQLPSGKLISQEGSYADTLKSKIGCDSIIFNIQFKTIKPVRKNSTITICEGNSYQLPSGKWLSDEGVYSDTLHNVMGCDSIIFIYTLNVQSAKHIAVKAGFCDGEPYILPSGKAVRFSGEYSDTIKNSLGCDSILYTVQLSLKERSYSDKEVLLCVGQPFTLPSGKTITTAGLYMDTIPSYTGCDSVITTLVKYRAPLTAKIDGILTVCEGQPASLKALSWGGMDTQHSYKWSLNGATSDILSFKPTKDTKLVLTVTDGCSVVTAKDSVTINVTPFPKAEFSVNGNEGCAPFKAQFTSKAVAHGGSAYKWTFGTGDAGDTSILKNPSFTFTSPGRYIVKLNVENPGGCSAAFTDTIFVADKPVMKINGPSVVCEGSEVKFTGSADLADVIWEWNFGNGHTASSSTPPAQYYPRPGNYSIVLKGSVNSVCSNSAVMNFIVAPKPVINLNIREAKICKGESLQLTAHGGVRFDWSPAAGLNNAAISFPLASPAVDTKYQLKVTNEYGCINNDSVDIKVSQPITVVTTADTTICEGSSVQLNAWGALTYKWSPEYSMNLPHSSSTIAKPDATTTYTVIGYGNDNCFTDRKQVTVTVIPLPKLQSPKETSISAGSTLPLSVQTSQDVNQYSWTPSTYLNCTTCPSPLATPSKGITYNVTVSNAFGCKASDSLRVSLICSDADVFLPNTFTPNGDGANDIFYPRGKGIRTIKFIRIFNRWGEMVYEKKDFNIDDRSAGWDGIYKGAKQASGVYVYTSQMVCDNGQLIEKKGSVMIMR